MKKIAIDIGHASKTGARGNGYDEHEMCAMLAQHVKKHLESYKVQQFQADIIDFPTQSNSGDLSATVKAINAGGYDASVSLHMDAASKIAGYETVTDRDGLVTKEPIYAPNPTPHGAHVCYYSTSGKRLANEIAIRLCPQMTGRANKTVKRDNLYVLKKTKPVAVLVECGFITNPNDAAWVKKAPDKVALSIALGIAAFLA
jgi:N-acetylmuramoyl-L-alanine amidase